MLEISDPERDGGIVLKGKATWFNPDLSRYCVYESGGGIRDEDGGGAASGGSSNGGGDRGETPGGCAHWIAADKLVGAKAVRVDQRSGKRFVVEPLPSVDGEEGDTGAAEIGDQVNGRVKLEEKEDGEEEEEEEEEEEDVEEEGVGKEEEGAAVEGGVSSTEDREIDMEDGSRTTDDEEQKCEENGVMDLDETESDEEEESRTTADGKRRRRHSPASSRSSSSDAPPSKRSARLGTQTREDGTLLERDSPPPPPEPDAKAETLEWPPSRDQDRLSCMELDGAPSSEGGDTTSSTETVRSGQASPPAGQQQRGVLPAVQVPVLEQPAPFTRYPIRGRLRRATSSTLELHESGVVEAPSAAKRPRVGKAKEESPALPSSSDSKPEPDAALTCPGETGSVSCVSIAQGAEEGALSCPTPQEREDSLALPSNSDSNTTPDAALPCPGQNSPVPLVSVLTGADEGVLSRPTPQEGEESLALPSSSDLNPKLDAALTCPGETGSVPPVSMSIAADEHAFSCQTPQTAEESLASPSTSDPNATPDAALTCQGATGPVPPTSVPTGADERALSLQMRQERPLSQVSSSGEPSNGGLVGAVAVRSSAPGYDFAPGWPCGVELFGQVPVMRVRALNVSGDGEEKTYFAGAYQTVAVAGIASDRRPLSRFSFRFEELEETRAARLREPTTRGNTNDVQLLAAQPQRSRDLDGARKGRRGEKEEKTRGDAVEGEAEGDSSRSTPSVGEPRAEKEDLEERYETSSEESEAPPRDAMPPSPYGDDDASEIEDGEIETLPDGRADIMPPSPRDDDTEPTLDMPLGDSAVGQSDGVDQAAAAASDCLPEGVVDQTAGDKPGDADGGVNQTKPAEEDMEISSDDQSSGEPGRAANSSTSSDQLAIDMGDGKIISHDTAANAGGDACGGDSLAADEANPSSNGDIAATASVDACGGDSSAADGDKFAVFSPGVAEIARALQARLAEIDSSEAEQSDSGIDVASENRVSAAEESTAWEPTQEAPPAQVLSTTFVGDLTPISAEQVRTAEDEAARALAQKIEQQRQQQEEMTLALRRIVREQLKDILLSASKGGEAALASGNGNEVLERIATDVEQELFGRLYRDSTGGREYKVCDF